MPPGNEEALAAAIGKALADIDAAQVDGDRRPRARRQRILVARGNGSAVERLQRAPRATRFVVGFTRVSSAARISLAPHPYAENSLRQSADPRSRAAPAVSAVEPGRRPGRRRKGRAVCALCARRPVRAARHRSGEEAGHLLRPARAEVARRAVRHGARHRSARASVRSAARDRSHPRRVEAWRHLHSVDAVHVPLPSGSAGSLSLHLGFPEASLSKFPSRRGDSPRQPPAGDLGDHQRRRAQPRRAEPAQPAHRVVQLDAARSSRSGSSCTHRSDRADHASPSASAKADLATRSTAS